MGYVFLMEKPCTTPVGLGCDFSVWVIVSYTVRWTLWRENMLEDKDRPHGRAAGGVAA